jgi:hypothetical protein
MTKNNQFENAGLHQYFSEGKSSVKGQKIRDASSYDPQNNFVRLIVLDVISDPAIIDENKKKYWEHVLHVSNMKLVYELPRNTIIAKIMQDENNPLFVFPFFRFRISKIHESA